jgi:hypothetical protein
MGEADARPGYALLTSSMNFLLGPATIAPEQTRSRTHTTTIRS